MPARARPTAALKRRAPHLHPSPRKADTVANNLLERIVAGGFTVGATLPTEDELADEYKVNRSVVREAIKLLEVHSLVKPVRRRGTEVLDPMASISPRVLRAMLSPAPGRVDLTVLASFLELRAAIDVEMSTLAAQRRTPKDVARMRGALAAMGACLGDQPAYADAHGHLSDAIAAATHSVAFTFIAHWHQQISLDLDRVYSVVRQATGQHLAGMTFLVDLMEQGDVDTVRQVLNQAHAWGRPRMLAAAALLNGDPMEDILADANPSPARPGPH